MSMTLLELTNKILNKLSSNEVDSIEDTNEATLYANEILDVFLQYHSKSREAWVKNKFKMNDKGKFVLETPKNVQSFDYIKYNGTKLEYVNPSDFEDRLFKNKGKEGYDEDGYGINKMPEYFTSYDQVSIEVNSIDTKIEQAVSGSKTSCYGKVRPTVKLEDDYIPSPLLPSLFDALLSDATANCLNRYREKSAQHDRQEAQKIINRTNRNNRFDYNYLYNTDKDINDNDVWGF